MSNCTHCHHHHHHHHHHRYFDLQQFRSLLKQSFLQSVIQQFLFQFPVPSRILKVIQQLLTSSLSSFCHLFLLHFLQKCILGGGSYTRCAGPLSLPSYYCVEDISSILHLLNACTSSFFTRSLQLIISILLHHHISKYSKYL